MKKLLALLLCAVLCLSLGCLRIQHHDHRDPRGLHRNRR